MIDTTVDEHQMRWYRDDTSRKGTMKDPFSSLKHDEPWNEEMVRLADQQRLESAGYHRALAASRYQFEQEDAQRQERLQLLQNKESVAKYYVGHWAPMIWERIVCGDYPPEFSTYTAKMIGVLERAALISIDVIKGNRPSHPDVWSRTNLEARIIKFKAKRQAELKASQAREQRETDKRSQSINRQKLVEHEHQAQETELSLSPLVRDLKRQIGELSAMITSKEESLYADTLNERAHDRLYESMRRDGERIQALHRALADAEREGISVSNEQTKPIETNTSSKLPQTNLHIILTERFYTYQNMFTAEEKRMGVTRAEWLEGQPELTEFLKWYRSEIGQTIRKQAQEKTPSIINHYVTQIRPN